MIVSTIRYSGKCSKVLTCLVLDSIFTGCIHSNRGDVLSFARKIFTFCGVSTVDFRVQHLVGVFRLRPSGKAMSGLCLLSKLFVGLKVTLKSVEIYFFYGLNFCVNRKIIGLWSVYKTVGFFDPSIKNSCSVNVYILAVHSLISVESLSSAWVKSVEFADIMFI